jgi:hypothetical protein
MPLVVSTLQSALKSALGNLNAKPLETAQKIAQAYTDYAQTGMAGPVSPILTPGNTAVMWAPIFQALISPSSGTASMFCNAVAQGVMSFWLSPPALFAGGGIGIANAIPGIASLPVDLQQTIGNPKSKLDEVAMAMATSMHTATLTLIVLVTIPPAPPVPLPFM